MNTMEYPQHLNVGQLLDHATLKEVFHQKHLLLVVCNPGKDDKSLRYMNKEAWKMLAEVPIVIRTFLCKLAQPPEPDLEVFKECIIHASRYAARPVVLVSVVREEPAGKLKQYRVVFSAKEDVFHGSVSEDLGMAFAAWTVMCRQSRNTIYKCMELSSTFRQASPFTHFLFQMEEQEGCD
jgi:hypothetical protein